MCLRHPDARYARIGATRALRKAIIVELPGKAVSVEWNKQKRTIKIQIHVEFESDVPKPEDKTSDIDIASNASQFVTLMIHRTVLEKAVVAIKSDLGGPGTMTTNNVSQN
jgi:hypothetical protein